MAVWRKAAGPASDRVTGRDFAVVMKQTAPFPAYRVFFPNIQ
jgi:hypothetical protein